MKNSLKFVQDKFTHGLFREVGDELAFLESALAEAGSERIELVGWVFKENKMGFVGTRQTAGLILYHEAPDEFWKMVNELMRSTDPDDRDTAFTSLRGIDDVKKYELLRLFLFDDYLWFEAVDFFIENRMNWVEVEEILFQRFIGGDPQKASAALNRLGRMNADRNNHWKVHHSYVPMRKLYSPSTHSWINLEAEFLKKMIDAVQIVASDFEQQCTYFSPFAFMPDEVALTFNEAFQFFDQVVGAKLVNEAQVSAVEAIHHSLMHLSQNKMENLLWTTEAMKTSPAWQQLRTLGKNALLLFKVDESGEDEKL